MADAPLHAVGNAPPFPLYTGKARSYLIKKCLPFNKFFASDPRFMSEIVARIGHFVVPVMETPEGVDLLQGHHRDH